MSESEMFHTRRSFLERSLALLSTVWSVPLFLERTAWATTHQPSISSAPSRKRTDDSSILVVVQLAGGNDGLNTLIPVREDRYYQARPRLAIDRKSALALTGDLALHPQATGLKQLYDDGLLAIVQGVGYPNPDRSHFVATDIWSTADPNGRSHEGWIGRYFDCACKGHDRPDPRLGIALTQESPLAMMGRQFTPVAFTHPDELTWRGANDESMRDIFDSLNDVPADSKVKPSFRNEASALAYLRRTAMDARAGAREIQEAAGASGTRTRWDAIRPIAGKNNRGAGELGQQLAMVHRMIVASLPTRVYYVSLGGFDTHANQADRHGQLLAQLGEALAGFLDLLRADGLLDRVLVMTFSEFGRRVAENVSGGTDHGAAAPMFLLGGKVRPGLHGAHPSLEPSQLDHGDLRWRIDFRSVYATILSKWLRVDAARVLHTPFKVLPLLRGRPD